MAAFSLGPTWWSPGVVCAFISPCRNDRPTCITVKPHFNFFASFKILCLYVITFRGTGELDLNIWIRKGYNLTYKRCCCISWWGDKIIKGKIRVTGTEIERKETGIVNWLGWGTQRWPQFLAWSVVPLVGEGVGRRGGRSGWQASFVTWMTRRWGWMTSAGDKDWVPSVCKGD